MKPLSDLKISTNRIIPRKSYTKANLLSQLEIQSMVIPGIIFLIIFCYIPMYGAIIAFKDYRIHLGFLGSPWAGLKHFEEFLLDRDLIRALRNSIGINVLGLFVGFPLPIILALLLNEIKSNVFKRFTQTVSYLPHFVSWVIFGGIIIQLLSPGSGFINNVLTTMGIIKDPILFMGKPQYFWVIFTLTNMLKGLGWGSILYLAAISGINTELYDAVYIDGANRFQKMRYVIVPSIAPTIVILLIFYISNFFKTAFDPVFILQNSLNVSMSETIETYTYKVGMINIRFSYATAVGLTNSIIAFILLNIANKVSKKITEHGLY